MLEGLSTQLKGSRSYYVTDSNERILTDYVTAKDHLFIGEKPIVEHLMYQDYLTKTRLDIEEEKRCIYVITTWPVLLRDRAFAYSKTFPFIPLFNDV